MASLMAAAAMRSARLTTLGFSLAQGHVNMWTRGDRGLNLQPQGVAPPKMIFVPLVKLCVTKPSLDPGDYAI